jgi:hypothetical protein
MDRGEDEDRRVRHPRVVVGMRLGYEEISDIAKTEAPEGW